MTTIIARSFYQGLPGTNGANGLDGLGIKPQPSCAVASDLNVASLSGLLVVDSYGLTVGDRVLLVGQATGSQNGPWVASLGSWTRPTDYTSPSSGWSYAIEKGSNNRSAIFVLLTEGAITVNTTSTTWTQYSANPLSGIDANFVPDDSTAFSITDTAGRDAFVVESDGSISIASKSRKPTSILPSDEYALEITDESGAAALTVSLDGTTTAAKLNIGRVLIEDSSGFSISDGNNEALRIDPDGTVTIANLVANGISSGGVTPSVAAWNENNTFWNGFAPVTGATSSYDQVKTGAATSAVADDFSMRQNYFCQFAGKAVKAYFDHSSDHVATFQPGATIWNTAPTMFVGWGCGLATGNSWIAGSTDNLKRGTIQGERRKSVSADFFGWSDEIALDVPIGRYLTAQTTQNIQGTLRLSAAQGATGTAAGGARSGGFMNTLSTRWANNINSPSLVLNSGTNDVDGCAGIRFLAIKTPIDIMIAVSSDSIARGILFTSLPAPSNWPSLLVNQLITAGRRAAVWHQGAGGGRAYSMSVNERYLNRIANCTHLIITLGSNDIADGRSAAQLQADVTILANHVREFGAKVFVATVIPRTPYTSPQNTVKNTYNTWVRSNPFDGYFDFHAACETPGSPDVLLAAYDGGDGIHPNTAGHTAMLSTIPLLDFY